MFSTFQIEAVEVVEREKPRMSFTAYQGRTKWRNYNRSPRIILKGSRISLNESVLNELAQTLKMPVLKALGLESRAQTELVWNPSGGDNREPVLEIKKSSENNVWPRADVLVFISTAD